MRYARVLAVGCVVGATLIAAGCGSDDDGGATAGGTAAATTTATSSGKPVNVAYVSYAYTDFVQAEEKGVEDVVAPAGGSVKMFNANFDPQKFTQQCQDAANSGRYDAILAGPVDPPTGVPCVKAAQAAGIPVVTIENPAGPDADAVAPQLDGVVGAVSITPANNAENMVGLAKAACAGLDPCRIIAEVATPSDVLTNRAVDEVAKQVPNAEIVQKIVGMYDPATIAKAFPDALSAHPDAQVFLSAADSQALAVLPAIKAAGREGDIKLVGNGGSRLGAKAVADGTLFATAGNWPAQMGKAAAELMTAAVNGQEIAEPGVDALALDTPRILTKDTVGEFEAEWGAGS